ncbi:hypothetical protein ABZT43_45325, partial [Streptomyces sp. NPDC005349]|uniref:hypothetical protein n=1 Tax=Streptomyces sp. NPDC005349 TaxID=3157037 RepID=UPI0033B6B5A8
TAPINKWIMEQLIMIDALKRASFDESIAFPVTPGKEVTAADPGTAYQCHVTLPSALISSRTVST